MRTLPLRIATLLLALTAVALVSGACTTEDGTTPKCGSSATSTETTHDNCDTSPVFPVCAEDPTTAKACCVDADKKPLTGRALDECLYGFGIISSINVSSSTTSSGAGGEGGSGGNGGAGGNGGTGGT